MPVHDTGRYRRAGAVSDICNETSHEAQSTDLRHLDTCRCPGAVAQNLRRVLNLISFQVEIATTGTAQNLPANPVSRKITISAKAGNAANVVIGNSSAVTASTGYILAAGQSVTVELSNTDAMWII